MKRPPGFDTFVPLVMPIAYSNVWLAATGSGLAYVTLLVSGSKKPDLVTVALTGLIVFVVYTLDKVLRFDPVADEANDPERTAFIKRFRVPLLVLGAAALVGGGVLAYLRGWTTLALFLAPIPIAAAYGTPFLPKSFRVRRLKDITGGKSAIVGVTWAVMAVTLPLAATKSPLFTHGHALLFAWVTGRMLFNTIFFDVGDVEGDTKEGVRTIPVAIGVERTHHLLLGIIAVTLVVGVVMTLLGARRELAGAVVITGAIYDFSIDRAAVKKEVDMGFLCDVAADAYGIVAGAAALASAYGGA